MTTILPPVDAHRAPRTVDLSRLRRASDASARRHAIRRFELEEKLQFHESAGHPVRCFWLSCRLCGLDVGAAFSVVGFRWTKRLIDAVVSSLALLALLPLFLAVAALIKCSDKGPVLFWQFRVGRGGKSSGCRSSAR